MQTNQMGQKVTFEDLLTDNVQHSWRVNVLSSNGDSIVFFTRLSNEAIERLKVQWITQKVLTFTFFDIDDNHYLFNMKAVYSMTFKKVFDAS